MPKTVVLMESSDRKLNVTGPAKHGDGWFGHIEGLYTVAIYTQNLKGRVYIEGSISLDPKEDDWFSIPINGKPYIEFPVNPASPTGELQGDTGIFGFTFQANIVWIRARLDRCYLSLPQETERDIADLGIVRKILLSR